MTNTDFSQSMKTALEMTRSMKAEGATSAEITAALEKTVRAAWPFTREWKYLCQTCRDFGLDMRTCPGDATCGRTNPHQAHEYGLPCFCNAGVRFRQPAPEPPSFTKGAGKTTKPRGFTRWGR